MRMAVRTISLLLALAVVLPVPALASWWRGGGGQTDLDLETGYDANTVTTASGRVTAILSDQAQPQVRFELETGEGIVMVVLGPRRYWTENGIELKSGDRVTVRGSKAQGKDGVVYLLAQWLRDESGGGEVTLRNESGRPYWAGNRAGRNGSGSGPLRQRAPGRLGGGRGGR